MQIKYVQSHVEVYGDDGSFLFSADTLAEAMQEAENCEEAA